MNNDLTLLGSSPGVQNGVAPKKKTAVVYCRTSTKGQKDAATIDAQIEACKRLLVAHGLTPIEYGPKGDGWIRDNGVSGSLLQGRAFSTLIDDLQRGRVRVDFLVCYSMSRLSRHDKASKDMEKLVASATDKARIMAVLNGANVKIVDSDGVNDPASVLTEIKETLSGEEYRAIRKRTMDGKARVLATGAWATGGRVPYGYRRVYVNSKDKKQGTTLAIDPDIGPRMVQLMEWYVEGGATHAATKAMENKWPAPRGTKTLWYPSTVQQIRNNISAHLGSQTLSVDGQEFEIAYPALITAKLHAAIERRSKTHAKAERTNFISTGHIDCECGRHIVAAASRGNKQEGGRYFVHCRNRCGRAVETTFAATLWECIVARLVQIREAESPTNRNGNGYDARLKEAKGKLDAVQKKIDRLLALHLDDAIDRAAYTTANKDLRGEKKATEETIERIKRDRDDAKRVKIGQDSVKSRVNDLLKRAKTRNLEGRRKTLGALLQGERIVLSWGAGQRSVDTLQFPAFGALLPAVTIDLSKDVTTQLHGVSREVLDLYYDVEDVVEDVDL